MDTKDATILDSWHANAPHWIAALDAGELESRKLITNQAIIDAVCAFHPTSVLDVGCGEGWLCRALQTHGISTVGVDGVSELVHHARMKGPGHFEVASFEELIATRNWTDDLFDGVVFNFCLYEKEITEQLLHAALAWVLPAGKLFIQTLHPFAILSSDEPYADGWKTESWAGLKRSFSHPYKWYYRTMASWLHVVRNAGWKNIEIKEPIHPKIGKPASLIITASK
jgi:2-polyprenyl-3-methyl-5-hydroxy-6-metoxy-1,4-benzoquinol methylase